MAQEGQLGQRGYRATVIDPPKETVEAIYRAFDGAHRKRRYPLEVVLNPSVFEGAAYLLGTKIRRDCWQREDTMRLRDEWGFILEAPLL